MKRIFLDFETYYDSTYSLLYMSAIEYIAHWNFEMLGCGVAVDDGDPIFMPQTQVINFLRDIKEPYVAISHNALFDMLILSHLYQIHPTICVDTMSMSRALLAHETKRGSVSLATILAHLGLQGKLDTLKDMRGVHWTDLTIDSDLLLRFVTYTLRDVVGCREIYDRLIGQFPAQELRIMDRTIRMVTQPQLMLDANILHTYYMEITTKKENILAQLGHDKAQYMSAEKFATLLRQQGVDPPRKWSQAQQTWVYAFARTDPAFIELQEHPNPTVGMLVEARLGLKTTIEETRTRRLFSISDFSDGWLPVPLKYSGTHTHRFSGDWKLNLQNLSVRKTKTLRTAIYAPEDNVILAVDAAQIEARITAWLAGESQLLSQFASGSDVYSWFGSQMFGYSINKKDHPTERFTAKTIVLGLGYGMGATKLLLTLTNAAAEQGFKIKYTIEQCLAWVDFYRRRFPFIRQLWRDAQFMLNVMVANQTTKNTIGPCFPDGQTIVLPSGLRLYYDSLSFDGAETTYIYGDIKRKIYGAKLIENVVQSLDHICVAEANIRTETRCRKELGLDIRLAMQVHDENVYAVPKDKLDPVKQIALEEMSRSPVWGPDLPLAAEAKVGQNFGELQ